MVTLIETANIPAPFEKLDAWVDNFEEEFVKWSPLHLECELFDKGVKKGDTYFSAAGKKPSPLRLF